MGNPEVSAVVTMHVLVRPPQMAKSAGEWLQTLIALTKYHAFYLLSSSVLVSSQVQTMHAGAGQEQATAMQYIALHWC